MKLILFNKQIEIRSPIKVYSLPTAETWGLTNRTVDNHFLVFLDYDSVEYNVVKEDIRYLQRYYDVGTMMTRQTKFDYLKDEDVEVGSYHAIGFTKFTFPEVKKLINLTRCDDNYKEGYKYQSRCWVLRVGEKRKIGDGKVFRDATKFKELIPAKTSRTASLGLIRFFELLDGIELRKYFKKVDNIESVELIEYVTGKPR